MHRILTCLRAVVRFMRTLCSGSTLQAEIYFPAQFEKEGRVGCRIPLVGKDPRRNVERFRRELRAYEATNELVAGPQGFILAVYFPRVLLQTGKEIPLADLLWEIETWVYTNFGLSASVQELPSPKSVKRRLALV